MLILEAKVRDGCKPVLTLDERANVEEIATAMINLYNAVFDRLTKRGGDEAFEFLNLTMQQAPDV